MAVLETNSVNKFAIRLSVFLLLFMVGNVSQLLAQSQADIQLLKKLAEQQRQETVLESETIEAPEEIGPTISEIPLPEQIIKGKYFGYSFFKSSKSISVLNNLPVPADYILGPGDEIVITLWGETELISTHEISKSNTIYIERVGLVNLAGKKLSEAEQYLKRQLERAYSTLKGSNPRTFMDISIGKLKSINVNFVGEVSAPGLYPVHPFSTLITGLMQAGGVDTTGSLREIQVIRDDQIVTEIDLYAYLLEGSTNGDIRLRDNDVVFVPVRNSDVFITGQTRRSGVFELKVGESAADLVKYSGGLKATARSPLELKRIRQFDERLSEDMPLDAYSIPISEIGNWILIDGDSLFVHSILPDVQEIRIRGQVKVPGAYSYIDSMSLIDALQLAGGIEDPSFLPSINLEKGEILRKNPEGDYAIIVPFNLGALLRGNQKENILLQNNDIVVIRRAEFYHQPEEVTIQGEVTVPGVYSIREKAEALERIIERAGGFSERAFPEGLIVLRDNKRLVTNDLKVQVLDGDEITVPRKTGTVEVRGEVYSPALIHYSKRMNYKEYIESAGGFTDQANKRNVSVIYPNGDIKVKSWFSSPKVVEGSILVVHQKPESEPLNMTVFLKEVASIAASLATIIFVLSR